VLFRSTAGVYARQSGFNTTIIESHSIPGGNCTSWRRKGYLFEGAIHWLCGTSPHHPENILWREIGALNDTIHVYNHDPYLYTTYEGRKIFLYRDLNRLKEHFLQISPEDAGQIKDLCRNIQNFSMLKMPVTNEKGVKLKKTAGANQMGIRDIFAMLPVLMSMNKQMKTPVGDYVKRFRHKGIQRILLASSPPDAPVMSLFFYLATMCGNDGGYPEGGSLAMTERMTRTFTSLGGELILNTRVQKILVENGAVCGVDIGGERFNADCVIAANDTLVAIDTLFDIPLQDTWVQEIKRDSTPCNCSFAGIGVRADLSGLPHVTILNLEKPLEATGEKLPFIPLYNYAEYRSYAPPGCSALTIIFGNNDTYQWWKDAKTRQIYDQEKENIKQQLEHILAEHIPETKGKIDVIDIATPITYERYTGTWHGSYMSRMKTGSKLKTYPCKIKNISGLVFAGQADNISRWLAPGA
jgi:phytoene dehydrogenase-like protein